MRTWDNWNRYFDNNNKPLHGCIQFMVKDGNTVAPIYDVDGTALDNPIITDIYGRTLHQVCIDEDVVAYFYKYVGNGIWSSELDIDTSDTSKWALQYTSESDLYVDINNEGRSSFAVMNIEELRDLNANDVMSIDGVKIVTLMGYNEAGDKEPINYIWNADSTAPDDGGAVIATDLIKGRWIMVCPTEHLDVRHYGVFPSDSQNMLDQTLAIQYALVYANNHGLRLFFDTLVNTQYYHYYKITNITLNPINQIDVAKGVYFIDDDVTIHSQQTNAFRNDPYFLNGDTTLYSNYAKASWNIKALSKSKIYEDATYVIDDNTHSASVNSLQGWNVDVEQNITGYTFTQCNIYGTGLISNSNFVTCQMNMKGTLGDGNRYTNVILDEYMFNGSPVVASVVNCTFDIDDFTHKVNLWDVLYYQQYTDPNIDFKNINIPSNFAIAGQYNSDRTYSNFIGTGTFNDGMGNHAYTFNNCSGNITVEGDGNNTYIFNNCIVNLDVTYTNQSLTFIFNSSTANVKSDLPNSTIVANSSNVTLKNNYANVSLKDSIVQGVTASTRLVTPNFSAYSCILNQEVTSSNIVIKDSQINKDIYSTEYLDNNQYVIDCYMDNDIFNAQHHLSSSNSNTIVRGAWVNNTGNVANPIVIDMTNIANIDGLHKYEYENNNGTFLSKYYKQTYMLAGCYTIYGDVWSAYYLNRPELFTVPHLVYRGEAFPINDGGNRARYAYGVFIPQLWQPDCAFFSIGTVTKRIKLTIQVPFTGNIYPLNGTTFSAINTMTYTYSDSAIVTATGLNHKLTEFNGHMLAGPQYIPYSNDLPKDVPHDSTVIPPVDATQGHFTVTIEIF